MSRSSLCSTYEPPIFLCPFIPLCYISRVVSSVASYILGIGHSLSNFFLLLCTDILVAVISGTCTHGFALYLHTSPFAAIGVWSPGAVMFVYSGRVLSAACSLRIKPYKLSRRIQLLTEHVSLSAPMNLHDSRRCSRVFVRRGSFVALLWVMYFPHKSTNLLENTYI